MRNRSLAALRVGARVRSSSGSVRAEDTATWHALPREFRALAAQNARSILLETAAQDGPGDKSFLFVKPLEELLAWDGPDLEKLLADIDRLLNKGLFVAGFFSYECGEHLVGLPPKAPVPRSSKEPMARLGVFRAPIEFNHCQGSIKGDLPAGEGRGSIELDQAVVTTDGLTITQESYNAAICRIHQYLEAGDTYQVNFTDEVNAHTEADPLAIYETLLRQQPVSFAAFVNDPAGPVLSFSPELFFRTSSGLIQVRPMKGTWPRGRNLEEDDNAEFRLRNDEKNRSEHVMIVDLLRNDLGHICKYGSVAVDKLFHVERYKMLLQMTSTCSGIIREDVSPSQVFATMFPSGSITGAPKRRAMEIIQELEQRPRGVYTGAIGYFAPEGESCFNVAIRTLKLRGNQVTMGVGGGIVADSNSPEEFAECNLKAAFLTKRRPPFSLIETMRCMEGIPLLTLHLERLSKSARYFGIQYDDAKLLTELESAAARCEGIESRLRLELDEQGQWTITTTLLERTKWHGRLILANERSSSTDLFLRHKTTNRDTYDRALIEARHNHFDEVLFLNEHEHLAEGAISNLFVRRDKTWITPSLECGVLPGVKRKQLINSLLAKEGLLHLSDLAHAEEIFVCNALRGVRPVSSIQTFDGSTIWP